MERRVREPGALLAQGSERLEQPAAVDLPQGLERLTLLRRGTSAATATAANSLDRIHMSEQPRQLWEHLPPNRQVVGRLVPLGGRLDRHYVVLGAERRRNLFDEPRLAHSCLAAQHYHEAFSALVEAPQRLLARVHQALLAHKCILVQEVAPTAAVRRTASSAARYLGPKIRLVVVRVDLVDHTELYYRIFEAFHDHLGQLIKVELVRYERLVVCRLVDEHLIDCLPHEARRHVDHHAVLGVLAARARAHVADEHSACRDADVGLEAHRADLVADDQGAPDGAGWVVRKVQRRQAEGDLHARALVIDGDARKGALVHVYGGQDQVHDSLEALYEVAI